MLNLTPLQKYQEDLQRDDFQFDAAQENAVKELQRLYDDLVAIQNQTGWKHKFKGILPGKKRHVSRAIANIQGIYFWGGVGRGKTYLVDTFYDCLPLTNKMRVHFHRFMHRVHEEMKLLAGQSDPLKIIAKKLAKETRIICFDEFFVSDITDAMILGTLFELLFAEGIVLVATSNIEPDHLYKNGLQRARFLPAIALLNKHTNVVNVDSGIDYRLRTLEQAEIYHYPLDEQATKNLHAYFTQLAPEAVEQDEALSILGREIATIRNADGVVMFDFEVLCGGPRSSNDYMELSRIYHTVLLADVTQMGAMVDDKARRFIAMVDEFYERNVKLIIAAEVAIDELYTSGQLTFEFKRCISRLKEMQSHEFLAREHLP
ncbi:cell division protein ZapE [Alteromonas sp. a30]|uniref:cell division protein ZapE n=1 Tax=Alteromonas sp. a30 TaxID=2730917 RepID=UPI0022820179|nr:cell division protein ZapE [Alteromonas sp. a30]MCY7294809.1 cell division protein ZapE [Alteromonas sp. a30]